VEAAIGAISSGLCYGWLPRHLIQADLTAGLLVPLPLGSEGSRQIPLYLSYACRDRAGIATRAMADLLLAN